MNNHLLRHILDEIFCAMMYCLSRCCERNGIMCVENVLCTDEVEWFFNHVWSRTVNKDGQTRKKRIKDICLTGNMQKEE
jgi:hypothetical protein